MVRFFILRGIYKIDIKFLLSVKKIYIYYFRSLFTFKGENTFKVFFYFLLNPEKNLK